MTEEHELEDKIANLTERLRKEKPPIYDHLMENPVTLPDKQSDGFLNALRKYKEHLEQLINND